MKLPLPGSQANALRDDLESRAAAGDCTAMTDLGIFMLMTGDRAAAARWFKTAADRGHTAGRALLVVTEAGLLPGPEGRERLQVITGTQATT